jgi:hypothetical protein
MTDRTAQAEGGIRETWWRAWLVFNELFSHTLVIASVIFSIEVIQWLIKRLHDGTDIIFFEETKFAYPAK